MNLKTQITKIHYSKNPKGLVFGVLKFCSYFYAFGSAFKNFLYDKNILKPKRINAFVISVGNFTTGGVGKTPVVSEIAKHLIKQGNKVAIVSRGYGGKLNNKDVHVISDGGKIYYNSILAGDEPFWLAENIKSCAVLTCSSRYKAAEYAVKFLDTTHIILDDGFQHRKLHRDLDLVLIDSEKMFGNENLLPAGPLREGIEGFNRIDKLVVVSKNIDHSRAEKYARIVSKKQKVETTVCKIEPDHVYNIVSGEHLDENVEITALSAIGQPEQFYKFLEPKFNIKNKITFDDHHQYTTSDIEKIEGNIVTTEKDAVKITNLNKTNIYALKLKTTLDFEAILKK